MKHMLQEQLSIIEITGAFQEPIRISELLEYHSDFHFPTSITLSLVLFVQQISVLNHLSIFHSISTYPRGLYSGSLFTSVLTTELPTILVETQEFQT